MLAGVCFYGQYVINNPLFVIKSLYNAIFLQKLSPNLRSTYYTRVLLY